MTGPDLKPCPFCGGTDITVFGPVGWYCQFGITHSCRVFFGGSGEFTIGGKNRHEAIDAWNRRAALPSATDTDALRAAEDRGIAIGLRAAAAWASDEANKCDDAAKWGGHRTYVANCKAAAYALRNAVLKIGGIKTDYARKIGGGE